MAENEKILIFGGAFNPPHIGHLHILQQAAKYIHPHKVIICVDKISPWKESSQLVPYSYRVAMINNLMTNQLDYEIYANKNNLVYTCDIIQEISKQNQGSDLFFLVGQDQYEVINTWNNYDVINKLSTIVCYRRGHEHIKRKDDRHIILPDTVIDCSSSDLRDKLDAKKLGQKNFDFIKDNGLYVQARIKPYMSLHRYEHTLRVLDTITKIAHGNHFNDEDILRCQTAALLHDIAKQYSDQELRTIISNDELSSFPSYHCAHGLAGARLATKDFDIHDQLVLDAIENHVIFKDIENPNKIAKALFLADKLEPARTEADIRDRAELLEQACNNLNETFKIVYKLNEEKY